MSNNISTEEMIANLPSQRCVSVVSSQASSSNNSVSSAMDIMENPFMTLVDCATSILDRKMESPPKFKFKRSPVTPETSKIPLDVEVKTPAASAPTSTVVSAPITQSVATTKSGNGGKNDNKKQTFAELLMSVLDDPTHEDIMTWMPDGTAFTIKSHKKFTMELMPKVFNIRNMSSFVRKLGRWGFHRVHEKETRNSDIFKHKNFHRGNRELCKTTVKCLGTKPSPATPAKSVINLVNTDKMSTPSRQSTTMKRSPSMVTRIPSPPAMVSPPSGDKAMLRLEHARRFSSHSVRPSFYHRGSSSSSNGLGNMTNDVVEAAIETLRRDEETVIVAMPKKYLNSHHTPPGMRVLGSSFGEQSPLHHSAYSHYDYAPHHAHAHAQAHHAEQARRSSYHRARAVSRSSSMVMNGPVSLNTRPTQSGVPKGWALTRSPGSNNPSPSQHK